MKIPLKFGIGADSSTFGLPRFATPHYEIGGFKMGVFIKGKIKTGFEENLGHCSVDLHINVDSTTGNTYVLSYCACYTFTLPIVRWSGKQSEKGGEDTYPAPHGDYGNTPCK